MTDTQPAPGILQIEAPAAALAAARDHLLGLQDPQGWWKAELETNVTMDAEDLMLRHVLGILDPELSRRAARWILSNQHDDGTFGTFYGGPPDLSATIEAYVALRLAGEDHQAPNMQAAAEWIRTHGGVAESRVFTRIWMAVVGQWDWESLPFLPPEIMFFPPSVPLNIYDFGCWARQTIVALTVVMAHRPAWPLPFSLHELEPTGPALPFVRKPQPPDDWAGPTFRTIDRILHRYERLPKWFKPRTALRSAALRRAEQWVIQRQEADGCWGGIQPPLVYSIIALKLQGYGIDHPVMKAAIDGMEGFIIDDAAGRRVEACQSPVWDTALATVALTEAGVPGDHPAIASAVDWLTRAEVRAEGDWKVRRPDLEPGGWAFEFANENYPDTDDTAEVVLALRHAANFASPSARKAIDDACTRGINWTLGLQCRDGGWGAFDVDNDSRIVAALPFCDFGEVTDPPSADVTAHIVEMLACEEGDAFSEPLERAVAWLTSEQEKDGSWFGRWGVNYIYGTGAVVPALIAAGVKPADDRIRRAVAWLEDHQQTDGGWGEDMRSYIDDSWRGRGASTASQTAWALLALIAAEEHTGEAVRRGIEWLVSQQRSDGTWDEPYFTGTGFPWDFNLNYHLYRLVFPVCALARYVKAVDQPLSEIGGSDT